MRGGWNDMALQAFTGLMLDRTNTRMGLDYDLACLANAENYGVTLLIQFESTPSVDHARDAATRLKGKAKYYEIVNEPNFSTNPQAYAAMVKQIAPVIKSIDPSAKVMGPDTCGIDLGWYDAIYQAGAGKVLDCISIHDYERHGSIDYFHYMWKMGELRKIMTKYGDAKKEIWQTERALGGVVDHARLPRRAVRGRNERPGARRLGGLQRHGIHAADIHARRPQHPRIRGGDL